MAKQTNGLCKYCGNEYARSGMLRHLAACSERKAALNKETGSRTSGYYELLVEGKDKPQYWLIIEMKESATLKELDQFIRDIWVECCGHLSAFDIGGQVYEMVPSGGEFWGPPAAGMNPELKELFSPGLVLEYNYDFGQTTSLMIRVLDYRSGVWKDETVTILSRNNPPEIPCCRCGRRAECVDPERMLEGDGFWCRECLMAQNRRDAEEELEDGEVLEDGGPVQDDDENFMDEYLLPVCNSPRMGVCAYEGSEIYPDCLEPDKKAKIQQ